LKKKASARRTCTSEESEGVKKIAKDKENKGVWVTTSHFSVYGIGGSVYGVSGSVYGVSGNVIGPPPEPLPVAEVETTVPIEPIKEVEQPGFVKRIYLLVKAIILGR
jgi:Rieske Fe-S protein